MAPGEEMQTAMVNRSIRTIKAELEYLCDACIITPQTLSHLLNQIPPQTALHAPLSVGALPSAMDAIPSPQPPVNGMNNLSMDHNRQNSSANSHLNEKNDSSYFNPPHSPQPPPAYNSPPPPPTANWAAPAPLCQATAMYAYTSADAGDLELQPNDIVSVTEYLNAEWWKGKNSRTGRDGIFPSSYVKRIDDKAPIPPPNNAGYGNNYGNAPLEVSQMGNGQGQVPNKGAEMGKKFGKKLGNAAIFGAGATIGGNIVNSIF